MLFLLSACNKKASVKLSTTTYNSGDWVVKGSVKNTSNKMIVGVLSGDPDSNDSQIISINASDDDIPPTIKKGKFSGVISGIGSASYGKKNAKIYLDVVDKDFLDNNDIPEILSKKQIKQIKSEGTKITLKTSKKQIDYWTKLDSNDDVNTDDSDHAESSSTEDSTLNNGLTKLTHKVNNGLKNGFAGLNDSKVTVEGQTSIKPYTAGIEIYDKDFMDMAIERNSIMDVLNGIQSFKGYDQYENFNVTYYADLQNDKGKMVKHTKILSFGIEGSKLKQLDPSNMSSKDAKANVNDYREQSNIE
jgi:hypothetical protein